MELRIEIDDGADPIRGVLRTSARHPVRFHGWIELTAAIEACRHGDPPTDREPPETSG